MKRFCAIVMVVAGVPLGAQERAVEMVEWRYVGADQAASKHSPLADINASNVGRLKIAWEWRPGERPNAEYGTRPGPFQAMPLMIENVLYVTTMYNRVVALGRRDRRRAVGVRPAGLPHRGEARDLRLQAPRGGGLGRRRRQAHFHQLARHLVCARRRKRSARPVVRRERSGLADRRVSEPGHPRGVRPDLAAGGVRGSRHHREPGARPGPATVRHARLGAGVRRPHR